MGILEILLVLVIVVVIFLCLAAPNLAKEKIAYEQGHCDGQKECEGKFRRHQSNNEECKTSGQVNSKELCVYTQDSYKNSCRKAFHDGYDQGFQYGQSGAVCYLDQRQILNVIHRFIVSRNDFDQRKRIKDHWIRIVEKLSTERGPYSELDHIRIDCIVLKDLEGELDSLNAVTNA